MFWEIWKKIDWNGSYNLFTASCPPPIGEMALPFEELYTASDGDSVEDIVPLKTDVNIPILDNTITENEIVCATKQMKKVILTSRLMY
jgi:hypothetical protein